MTPFDPLLAKIAIALAMLLLTFAVLVGSKIDRYVGGCLGLAFVLAASMQAAAVPNALCDPLATIPLIAAIAVVPLLYRRPWTTSIIILQGFQLIVDAAFYAGDMSGVLRTTLMNGITLLCAGAAAWQSGSNRTAGPQATLRLGA